MISIIIPTCNRNDLLRQCLDLLSTEIQNVGCEIYEVIVADDSIANQAKVFLEEKYPWVKWIEGPKKGPAANRNRGVEKAIGDWLIFLDDDCLPQNTWLSAYLKAIETSGFLVLEGITAADRPKQRFDEEAPLNLEGNRLWSCNFAIKKSLFLQLCGFDEAFPYPAMEDVDFHTRVKVLAQVKFVPQAVVLHPWRKIKPFKNFKKHLFSQIYFAKKHQLNGKLTFRLDRTKIFLGIVIGDFKNLLHFSMRGCLAYLESCLLNFCLIFI